MDNYFSRVKGKARVNSGHFPEVVISDFQTREMGEEKKKIKVKDDGKISGLEDPVKIGAKETDSGIRDIGGR